ncbi:MAG TPA: lysine--tRNA ligase [Actinomycetota bacterium]|nr:lysine--tRNA ligase [Actinomycetota bacterium]
MSDEIDGEVSAGDDATDRDAATGREREVLKARRSSRERLGDHAFALNLRQALAVSEPDPASAIRNEFGTLGPDVMSDVRRTVAGRVVLKRDMGRLAFLVLRDRTGDLQVVVNQETEPESLELLGEVDLGDVIGASGRVGTTRKGELSVFAERLAMLTKALRPLPEKWHGLKDPELQQRQRYLHLATDPQGRVIVEARAQTLRAIRGYLDERGFTEVETPVLQAIAGGAMARPFATHHRDLDIDLYLRISLELYLKRLLVGGLERVYEIGRNFRNEGVGWKYNPEFTMLELYQAYADYETMMDVSRELVQASARAVRGSLRVSFRGHDIDLGGEWERVTVLGSVSEVVGVEVALDRPDLATIAGRHDVPVEPGWPNGKIALELFEKLVEPTLIQPTFVCDFPREVSPLARPHRDDPRLTEHVDPVIGGMELGTGYSELTDPDEQRAKFLLQQQAREAGEEETHPFDEDFLTALEHGMPPAGGLGLGIDRLLMLLTDVSSIREVILFPLHRPRD